MAMLAMKNQYSRNSIGGYNPPLLFEKDNNQSCNSKNQVNYVPIEFSRNSFFSPKVRSHKHDFQFQDNDFLQLPQNQIMVNREKMLLFNKGAFYTAP